MSAFALLLAALAVQPVAKPCHPVVAAEGLLARGHVVLGLAGTRRVGLDPAGACLEIDVATPGTARLAALILRTLEVPDEAIRLQVVL